MKNTIDLQKANVGDEVCYQNYTSSDDIYLIHSFFIMNGRRIKATARQKNNPSVFLTLEFWYSFNI